MTGMTEDDSECGRRDAGFAIRTGDGKYVTIYGGRSDAADMSCLFDNAPEAVVFGLDLVGHGFAVCRAVHGPDGYHVGNPEVEFGEDWTDETAEKALALSLALLPPNAARRAVSALSFMLRRTRDASNEESGRDPATEDHAVVVPDVVDGGCVGIVERAPSVFDPPLSLFELVMGGVP